MDPILETARDALGVTCDRKRHIVARRGVGSDVAPILDLRGEDGPLDEPRESTFDLADRAAYDGAIPDAVRQGYELQAHRNGPAQAIEAIGAMIGWTAIADSRP